VRVVITGASGNVGTALLRRLSAHEPAHEIVGVSRRPPQDGKYAEMAEWAAVDLADDGAVEALRPIVRGADAVVHLAWGFQPSHAVDVLEAIGVGGTRHVLAAARAEGVPHLVHMSSLGVYSPGVDGQPVDETWPTNGISTLAYSRHKVAAERLLDEHEQSTDGAPAIARLRAALVLQRYAGSALARYGFPGYLPTGLVRHLPVVPVDRSLVFQAVHTDDLADAIVRVLERQATGAFNLAADPPLTRDRIAAVLEAPPLHVPRQVLRTVVAATWHARVQALDPGWLDLAFAVPVMDTGRARRDLDWVPQVDAKTALRQVVDGLADSASDDTAVLRPRSVADRVLSLIRRGPISERRLP
jgi:UDP-glucose 4-epimerase